MTERWSTCQAPNVEILIDTVLDRTLQAPIRRNGGGRFRILLYTVEGGRTVRMLVDSMLKSHKLNSIRNIQHDLIVSGVCNIRICARD